MSKILNKTVKVKRLGNGSYGTGYKISISGAIDTCLKIYYKSTKPYTYNVHGQHIEPQTAVFVNEQSNDFVKMFFGKLSPIGQQDGFIVTQFISKNTKPIQTGNSSKYIITTKDADIQMGCNSKNGKIIDFGAVEVMDKVIY